MVFLELQYLKPDRKFIYNYIIVIFFGLISVSCHRNLDDPVAVDESLSSVVANVKVTSAKDGEVSLLWDAVDYSGAKYNVYYSDNKKTDNFKLAGVTSYNYFSVRRLNYDSRYYFAVKVKVDSVMGDFSEIVSAIPANAEIPTTPSTPSLYGLNDNGKRSIGLIWNHNKESDIAKYYIYRADDNESSGYRKIGENSGNTFTDYNNIETKKIYYYKIKAVDNGGWVSEFSSSRYEYILDTVKLIYPKEDDKIQNNVVFKWSSVDSAIGYRLVLCNSITNTGFWMKDVPATGAEEYSYLYDGDSLPYKKNYYWKVCAFYKSWNNINSYSKIKSFFLMRSGDE